MAEFSVSSVSIVVVANLHNPSIMNHDFLLQNQIITQDWGSPQGFMSTPPFSAIQYPLRSIELNLQQERLVATKRTAGVEPDISDLCEACSTYAAVLPHIRYSAVGINPTINMNYARGNPTDFLRERFLSPVIISNISLAPDDVSLSLKYREAESRLISLDIKPMIPTDGTPARIESVCNYHVPNVTSAEMLAQIVGEAPRRVVELVTKFRGLVTDE